MNPFLADPALTPLWRTAAAALDRNGLGWEGRLTLPELTTEGRRRLGVLLERPVPADRKTVPLAELATAVRRLTDTGLPEALGALGHPPAGRREATIARRDAARRRREALDTATERHLGTADWTWRWREAIWTDGLLARRDPAEIDPLIADVSRVLGSAGGGRSRTETAARLLGDAHALDSATRLAVLVTRALVARDGPSDERTAWERAGLPLDLVSAPALSWALPLRGDAGAAPAVRAATESGLPVHLSVFALRAAPLTVAAGTPVLVVENPRMVEGAAQRRLPSAVLCTNGNPTTSVNLAIAQLRAADADLRYHGDFDTPGLAMAGRARLAGCEPFRMTAGDYLAAVAAAAEAGVELPSEPAAPPATPWEPALARAFGDHHRVVHQERVMDEVLTAHTETP